MAAAEKIELPELPLEHELLFEMHADLQAPVDLGQTPEATRAVVYVTGGYLQGPKIRGEVLPGGGDWLRARSDGSMALDVRACAKLDDGSILYMTYGGRIVMNNPADAPKFLDFGNAHKIDTSSYYFRTQPIFEIASEKYDWLNRIVAVGVGLPGHGGVNYKVYMIK
ncbi:MAG: DUF3237 domain-containing protein [Pseudomonadota bacterium]